MKKRRDSDSVAKPVAPAPDIRRRHMLQAMLGAGALGLSPREVTAQFRGLGPASAAEGAAGSRGPLVSLPRQALVIGNSKYKEVPLKNPANDADAIGGVLRRMGFQVAQALDAGRESMLEAIQAYGSRLEREGAIGLFYFAGHGLQLAWRNYLVPVDAVIDNPDDVRARAVDLTALLQALTRAKNPMNVIILDACRDNPFGTRLTTGQRGLSQFDAPPGSLLAYATAPGNVASDGDGVNGLYTENLLREMLVPEARIEDIFKRVRLHVRKRTNGQQIPWESTSLEDDFFFVPPGTVVAAADDGAALRAKRLAEEEAERKRRQEQALREAREAAEAAERKRQQELAALEQKRIAEEAERNRQRELALKEAQRAAAEAERKRLEEQVLREAKLAEEEAARKYKEALALQEKQRAEAEAERKRREEQALREAKAAEEEARKRREALAAQEQREREEAERRRKQAVAVVAKPDAAEEQRRFEEELAIWEKIKASREPGPLEAYLLRYPSGRFAELAQLQLDRVLATQGEKRIEIVSAAENPYSKGTVTARTRYTVGNSYTYRVTDMYSKVEIERYTQTITNITDTEVIYDNGQITDLLGNPLRARDGRVFGPSQFVPLEFAVGKRWSTRFKVTTPSSGAGQVELDLRIAARESIAVPAGTFDVFRIEARGWSGGSWGSLQVTRNFWVAPGQVRGAIVSEDLRKAGAKTVAAERYELVSYHQA